MSYLLDIACRDYDFLSYGVDVGSDGAVLVYRVGRGGMVVGEKVRVGEEPVEVRVLRGREYYEGRAGCGFAPFFSWWCCGQEEEEEEEEEDEEKVVEWGDLRGMDGM